MKHLAVNEIIKYVSLTILNQEAISIASAVTGHICGCNKCMTLVRQFQMLYDAYSDRNIHNSDRDFEEYIEKKLAEKNLTAEMLSDDISGARRYLEDLTEELTDKKQTEKNLSGGLILNDQLLDEVPLDDSIMVEDFLENMLLIEEESDEILYEENLFGENLFEENYSNRYEAEQDLMEENLFEENFFN